MFDLHDVELYWENDQLDVDAVFRLGVDAPFLPWNFNDFHMGSLAENQILIDEEHDKENPSPLPTTPVSERPSQPPELLRIRPLGTRIKNFPDYIYKTLFGIFMFSLLGMCCKINYKNRVSYCRKLFQKQVRHVWDKNSSSIVIINFTSSSIFLHIPSLNREEGETP